MLLKHYNPDGSLTVQGAWRQLIKEMFDPFPNRNLVIEALQVLLTALQNEEPFPKVSEEEEEDEIGEPEEQQERFAELHGDPEPPQIQWFEENIREELTEEEKEVGLLFQQTNI